MNALFRAPVFLAGATALLFNFGCNSGGGSSSEAVDVSSLGDVSDTFNALEGLLFDEGEASSKIGVRSQSGDQVKSHLGCQYKQDRDRMLSRFHEFRKPLCYIASVEEQTGFEIGRDGYKIFRVNNPDAHEDNPDTDNSEFLIRAGIFGEGNERCLRFQICKGGTQDESLEICKTGENAIEGHVAHVFEHDEFSGRGSVDIEAAGDDDGLSTLNLRTRFEDNHGSGDGTLTADRTTRRNTFKGYFSGTFEDFGHEDAVAVIVESGKGSGHLEGSSSFPPQYVETEGEYYCPPSSGNPGDPWEIVDESTETCPTQSFEVTESFEIVGSGDDRECLRIDDQNSPVFEEVASLMLPSSASEPADFSVEWDCSGDIDGTIEFADVDVSACDELKDHRGEDSRSCYEEAHSE